MAVIKDAVLGALETVPMLALSKLLRRKAKEAGVEMPKKIAEAFARHVIFPGSSVG